MNKRDLPFHWESVSVDSITINLDRKRVPLNRAQRAEKEENGIYPYVGANNILSYINEYIYDEKILCVAEDGGAWGYNQKCSFIMNEKCWVNNHAHVLISKNNLILEYLKYYLNYTDLNMHINGATRGKLNKSVLNKIKIPLPPLAEQQKIAAILDAADQLRQKDQQLIDHYTTLSQSLFLEMFGDPVTNPMGWEKRLFLDVFDTKTGKLDSNAASDIGIYPFFTCAKEALKINSYSYDDEVLLLAGNNAAGIFDVKYYKGKFDAYQRTYILSLQNKALVYPFMKVSLEKKLKDLQRLSIGSSTKYLTMKILGRLEFIIPPFSLQNQFAQHIEKIEQQKQQAQASLEKSETLFNSLLQRAFKGELTINKS